MLTTVRVSQHHHHHHQFWRALWEYYITVTQSILASRACSKNIIGSQNHHLFARGLQETCYWNYWKTFYISYPRERVTTPNSWQGWKLSIRTEPLKIYDQIPLSHPRTHLLLPIWASWTSFETSHFSRNSRTSRTRKGRRGSKMNYKHKKLAKSRKKHLLRICGGG